MRPLDKIVSTSTLISLLLNRKWHKDCDIIPKYMPPHPLPNTKPKVVVYSEIGNCFLRHSQGPLQGYYWDVYPDDMMFIEWAIIALSQAPPAREVQR